MKWSAKRSVKELLLSVNTPIQSSELLTKARERNIGVGTLFKYLKQFEKEGIVRRIQKAQKNVLYIFDREANVKNVLEKLAQQVKEIILSMPIEEWSEDSLLKELIRDNRLRHKVKHEILTPMIFAAFIHEIHAMLLPEPLKDVEVYVGAFRKNDHVMLDIIPKQFVEELKRGKASA